MNKALLLIAITFTLFTFSSCDDGTRRDYDTKGNGADIKEDRNSDSTRYDNPGPGDTAGTARDKQ